MLLSQARAVKIPMPGRTLTLARVQADPTVSWHRDNASLPTGDPTFGGVTLTARTIAAVVPISLGLAQDAANIEQVIESTLVSATAAAIDSAGLNGTTVDAG